MADCNQRMKQGIPFTCPVTADSNKKFLLLLFVSIDRVPRHAVGFRRRVEPNTASEFRKEKVAVEISECCLGSGAPSRRRCIAAHGTGTATEAAVVWVSEPRWGRGSTSRLTTFRSCQSPALGAP